MYESHYLRAVDPARPRGAWIRHTAHGPAGEARTGALWCTVWDAEAGPPYARREPLPAPSPPDGTRFAGGTSPPDGTRFAGGTSPPDGARFAGRISDAAWDLRAAGDEPALRHLPRAWMYRAPLPRTKPESPLPDAVFTGWIEAAGRRVEVAGWRGMVGHNWGAEHAERWVWLHAVTFTEAPGAWLDVALGRVRVGGMLTPWVANGALSLDGTRHRLGGIGRVRATKIEARPGALDAVIGGAGATIRVSVAAPAGQTVTFDYEGTHEVLNCSIAQVRLRVERPGRPALELATAFGGAYELGAIASSARSTSASVL